MNDHNWQSLPIAQLSSLFTYSIYSFIRKYLLNDWVPRLWFVHSMS